MECCNIKKCSPSSMFMHVSILCKYKEEGIECVGSTLIGTYNGKTRRKESDTGYWPDPYITFDLLTKYKFKQSLDLYFGIYNLFDRTYYKSANINSTQSSIGIEQFAEPGRHFKCGFKFVF